jgi:hypothetical protein
MWVVFVYAFLVSDNTYTFEKDKVVQNDGNRIFT